MEGSNKLKNKYIAKMLKAKLTSAEFDFIMCLAMRQDNQGHVSGVYYREICKQINISYQEFYNILYALEAKGLIIRSKENYIDHEITITDNVCESKADFSEGYVHLTTMFTSDKFRKMKVGAKFIAIEMYKCATAKGGSYQRKKKAFYEEWSNRLGVQKRSIRQYLREIEFFFSVGSKNGNLYITPKKHAKEYTRQSETKNCAYAYVKSVCIRNKIPYSEKDKNVESVAGLIIQYQKEAADITRKVAACVKNSVEMINRDNPAKKTWLRELRPKFVHRLLKRMLHPDEQDVVEVIF